METNLTSNDQLQILPVMTPSIIIKTDKIEIGQRLK